MNWLIIVAIVFPLSLAQQCDQIPPSLWCQNTDVDRKCGFVEKCQNYQKASKNQPIQLTLLMEGLCPGCQAFIMEQLYKNILPNFAPDVVKIEIVPFGNAKVQQGSIVCQHGEEECRINKFESCLIDALPDQTQLVPVIYCLEKNFKEKVGLEDAASKCFEQLSVGFDVQRMVQSCLVSKLGENLQLAAGQRTADVWPEKHTHVPWLLFNNVSLSSAQAFMDDIPALICQWYVGDKPAPYCKREQKKMEARVNKRY